MNNEKALSVYKCRMLEVGDLEMVMNWRMSEHVTEYMNTDPVLTLENQKCWYDMLVASDQMYYWIVEVDGVPCGVINLSDIDRSNKRCGWGYYVAVKKLRSFELAASLEMSLYDYAFDVLGLNKVSGDTFCENRASVEMHKLCGCETEGILKEHIYKNGKYYDVYVQSMLAEKWRSIRDDFKYQKICFSL